ncbi:TetR/AcrR family transcriptional regulator [Catenulispora sp. NF23]|uniref:TetR/AcrR family transcriptional regulator n=1 Tax=Catenulispora pinistramenti TaxID=2705254 RepID=UPI001BA602B5|nr:TetR/AcrR family transcriptional regulator [Catenulispora pinistramenti]MBS2534726.1 TetR/AcrR family transcriptional regulator [Catenulispora pinistramenti]
MAAPAASGSEPADGPDSASASEPASAAAPRQPGRDRRSAAKHAAILDAATAVFLREGYARASVDAIAQEAGVGKQTVYGHFGDKQQLFLAVVEHVHAASPFDPADLIADTGDPLADLTAAATWIVRGVSSPRVAALHRLTIAELTHHPELQRSWRDDERGQKLLTTIAAYLAACDRRNTLSVPDPETVARQFVWLASVEAQVRSLRGVEPLGTQEVEAIAADTAGLIVRAQRPQHTD